jgi:16S rRNA (guanine(966)-N(2))-methyltransferase RsmD
MRIIAGSLKRRTILVPEKPEIRPSADRTREALFNRLQFRLDWEASDVLDLFAGSGSVGLEAISRGAAHVTFVESDIKVFGVLEKNVEKMQVEDDATLVCADVYRYLARYVGEGYELIFADPPYDNPRIEELPDAIMRCLVPGGIAILEHDRHHAFDTHPAFVEKRAYGRTNLSFFESPEPDEGESEGDPADEDGAADGSITL